MPESDSQPATTSGKGRRLWITIAATAAAVAVLAGLVGGILTFHATADRNQRRADAQTKRADGLEADLAGAKENLGKAQSDLATTRTQLNTAQANLTEEQNFSSKAAAIGAAFDRCVQDENTFLSRVSVELDNMPYSFDPTLGSFGADVGAECAAAQAAFHALGATSS
jgi:hypothetical protein